jgi:dihydrodipicolinate synthase/N-acetylneuraminate lyase
MKPFNGVISLVPTPLKKNGDVDREDLTKILDYQFENGCDGVGILAGIGEDYLLTARAQ